MVVGRHQLHGAASAVRTRTVQVANSAPLANFTVNPADPAINETTAFLDLTNDIDNDAVNWTWAFGDGAVSFERNATHVYQVVGTYDVTLTVRDAEGAASNLTRRIEVKEFATARPVAQLVASVVQGRAPLTVTFTLSGYDPDGTLANWTLDVGEGPLQNGPGLLLADNATFQVSHTYQRNGTFEVVFSLTDNLGVTGSNRTILTVLPPLNRPPQVRFEALWLAPDA